LGEIGDKTFFLILVLAAWCPWDGVRGGSWEYLQLSFVLLGAVLGLSIHICVVAAVPDGVLKGWIFPSPFGWIPEAASGVLLLLLALRAGLTCPPSKREDLSITKDPGETPETPKDEGSHWNPNAFLLNSTPPAPAQRLPLHQDSKGADGFFSDRVSDGMVSTIFALVGTLILVLLTESGDKAETIMIAAGRRGPDTAFGACLGILPAAFLATLLGFIMENQLSVRQLHIVVVFVLLSLSVASFSHCGLAFESLVPLSVPPKKPKAIATFGTP
jgi:putative Ca2+/H+ antiporter (TMEM165/GDT1 family)